MLKLNRKNESGRSMVEMLGVLAIVGVLSVMGIAGYTVAMHTHKANEAVNQASRYAMLISAQRQLNGGVGGPTTDTNGAYTFTLDDTKTNQIVMTANVGSEAVASKLAAQSIARVKIENSGANVTFTFENDLGDGSGAGSVTMDDVDAWMDANNLNGLPGSEEEKAKTFACANEYPPNTFKNVVGCCYCIENGPGYGYCVTNNGDSNCQAP